MTMESNNLKFKTIDEILNISTSVDKRILKLYFNKADVFRESRELYKKEDSLWLLSAINSIEGTFPVWLVQNYKSNKKDLLLAYKNICLYVYEDSDVFSHCDESEKKKLHSKLDEVIEHTNCYIEALHLIESGKHIDYVDDVIRKVKDSGYLYEPKKKMRILMSVFVLSKFSMREQIEPLFDAIIEKHGDVHFQDNYLEAMKVMLDMFIASEHTGIDKITRISSKDTRDRVKMLIKAIVILILLNKENGQRDTSLLLSRLYRYASLIVNIGKDSLLEKAYSHVLKTNSGQLEFSWKDIEDNTIITEKNTDRITLLCSKLSRTDLQAVAKEYEYCTGKGIIHLGSDINVYQIPENESKNKAFNDDILKWHQTRIWIRERLKEKVGQRETNIAKLQIMWNEVEKAFFSTSGLAGKSLPKVYSLSEGDEVNIRVTQRSATNPYHFECVVQQPPYVGKGFISINEIVHYPVRTDITSFQSKKELPLLIKAKILKIAPDGTIEFSLLENIGNYIYNSVKKGDLTECIISKIDEKNYTCVSEDGYALQFYRNETEEELSKGDIVEVEIYRKWPNGNVRGQFVRVVEDADPIPHKDAFTCLMDNYTGGEVYKEEEDVMEVEKMEELSYENISEFIRIVDYKAMTEKEHSAAYNYTAFCRLLALMIEDNTHAEYYGMRMNLIKQLYELGLNGFIDIEELNRQMLKANDILLKFPELNEMVTQFYIVSLLGKPWEEGKLWMLIRENGNETIQRLARLVLSYNLLEDLSIDEQRESIRNKISQLLGIEIKIPIAEFIGEEDEYTEFKTSLVYPAGNNMRYDIEKQMNVILKVICGFLNHKGGTLYIGVNDSGYVSGLEDDYRFFSKEKYGYDLIKAKNEMRTRFSQGAKQRLGAMATEKISEKFSNDSKYLIIDIEPSKKVVSLDGVVYVRRDASTQIVDKKELKEFEATRLKQ